MGAKLSLISPFTYAFACATKESLRPPVPRINTSRCVCGNIKKEVRSNPQHPESVGSIPLGHRSLGTRLGISMPSRPVIVAALLRRLLLLPSLSL